ncbi:hypothetical protein SAE01_14510 [Segetibacter aerophilus]|uniref:Outer membrane protein beta-barrel domain-containing protein n=2 Tax=Segetibacter aerophilus TaxID=670293 RepID=A0A512BAL1_9BACT|nr:hypothetical protein SAE01_14510 [Segetibacter aerophilus]
MQMEEFTLVPTGEVWKGVEARIRKEKGRRLLFFWLFAGLVLTGSVVGFFFFLNSKKDADLVHTSTAQKSITNGSLRNPSHRSNNSPSVKKVITQEKTEPEKEIVRQSIKATEKRINGNQRNAGSITTPGVSTANAPEKLYRFKPSSNQRKIFNTNASINNKSAISSLPVSRMEGRTELPPHKYLLSEIQKKQRGDTIEKSIVSTENNTPVGDKSLLPEEKSLPKTFKQKALRKLLVGFTLQAGLSDNIRGIGFGSQKSLLAFDQQNNASSPSTSTSSSFNSRIAASTLQYRSGFSWGVGVYVQKALSKKLDLSVGMDYHFMTTSSTVGNRVDSAFNIYDTLLQKSTKANSFYRGGQTTSYTNKYHLLQIPVNLQFQLNKNIHHPLQFSFGLSPSFLIGSNALYLNRSTNSYYTEKDQFSRFLLFGQSGLMYGFNEKAFQISVGPALQYNFNSFSKRSINAPQHLLFTGIKANIILK